MLAGPTISNFIGTGAERFACLKASNSLVYRPEDTERSPLSCRYHVWWHPFPPIPPLIDTTIVSCVAGVYFSKFCTPL